jgi:myosin-crossreactive antigen
MSVLRSGNVGIGTLNPQQKLSVNGTMQAKEVLVNTAWSDYVFDPGYQLPDLAKVADFVKINRHLPEIPSAAMVEKNGVNLGEMQSKLLAKVEELTLYLIKADEKISRLEQQHRELRKQLARLEP